MKVLVTGVVHMTSTISAMRDKDSIIPCQDPRLRHSVARVNMTGAPASGRFGETHSDPGRPLRGGNIRLVLRTQDSCQRRGEEVSVSCLVCSVLPHKTHG